MIYFGLSGIVIAFTRLPWFGLVFMPESVVIGIERRLCR
jgi:hypothetical protein